MSSTNKHSGSKRAAIDALLRNIPDLWRGHYTAGPDERGASTGFPELDAILPAGGWPARGLVEIVYPRQGMGELQLLLPLMRTLGNQGQWVFWACSPLPPYAPALIQAGIDIEKLLLMVPGASPRNVLWSMEQALRSCRLALAWQHGLSHRALRRLQLAANTGNSLAVLFQRGNSGSPYSALRLQLDSAGGEALRVNILQARGNIRRASVELPRLAANGSGNPGV